MQTPEKERHEIGGLGDMSHAVRTRQEVADIMTANGYPMGRRAVEMTERRALYKLRMALIGIGLEEIDRYPHQGREQ